MEDLLVLFHGFHLAVLTDQPTCTWWTVWITFAQTNSTHPAPLDQVTDAFHLVMPYLVGQFQRFQVVREGALSLARHGHF